MPAGAIAKPSGAVDPSQLMPNGWAPKETGAGSALALLQLHRCFVDDLLNDLPGNVLLVPLPRLRLLLHFHPRRLPSRPMPGDEGPQRKRSDVGDAAYPSRRDR